MDTSHARPAARTAADASFSALGFTGERQHAATPWAPTGAQARYDLGGERRISPSGLATPPAGPSVPTGTAAALAVPAPAGAGAGAGRPQAALTAADPSTARTVGTPAAAAAAPTDSAAAAAKPPGAEVPWAFQRQAHWEMPAQPRSVPAARHCTALLLSSWGVVGDDVEQIVLLVSELTTNATLHGRRDMSVDLTLAGSHVDLTVSDYGPVVSGRAEKLPTDESGRGLEIVNVLADGLHVQRHRTGTNAWASYRLAAFRHR